MTTGAADTDNGVLLDPREIIDRSAMSGFQWCVVAIMAALNALDGFDVLSISFAAPGIAHDWGIDRAALGIVLSMELIGMAVGSITLGRLGDQLGRRRTILACLPVMAAGMLGASFSHSVVALCLWRLLTGLGIGGMLAVTNAAVSEASNAARRSLCVVLMGTGYPAGAVIGGSVSALLLRHSDWPAVFQFGAAVTLCMIPLVWWRAPESVAFTLQRGGPGALAAVNRTLEHMGHGQVSGLPPAPVAQRAPLAALFGRTLLRRTVLLTLAYFAQLMTYYFLLKWIPKIVVDMGYAPSLAAGVLVWATIGGATGCLLLGLVSGRLPVRILVIAAMAVSAVMVVAFGAGQTRLSALTVMAAATGFFTNAGVVGLYVLLVQNFPTSVRSTATGLAIGVGRGGAALAPALAGFLFAAGYGLQLVAVVMALGSVIAMLAVLALRPPTGVNVADGAASGAAA